MATVEEYIEAGVQMRSPVSRFGSFRFVLPAYREWDDDELKAGLHYFVNVEELRKRFPRVSMCSEGPVEHEDESEDEEDEDEEEDDDDDGEEEEEEEEEEGAYSSLSDSERRRNKRKRIPTDRYIPPTKKSPSPKKSKRSRPESNESESPRPRLRKKPKPTKLWSPTPAEPSSAKTAPTPCKEGRSAAGSSKKKRERSRKEKRSSKRSSSTSDDTQILRLTNDVSKNDFAQLSTAVRELTEMVRVLARAMLPTMRDISTVSASSRVESVLPTNGSLNPDNEREDHFHSDNHVEELSTYVDEHLVDDAVLSSSPSSVSTPMESIVNNDATHESTPLPSLLSSNPVNLPTDTIPSNGNMMFSSTVSSLVPIEQIPAADIEVHMILERESPASVDKPFSTLKPSMIVAKPPVVSKPANGKVLSYKNVSKSTKPKDPGLFVNTPCQRPAGLLVVAKDNKEEVKRRSAKMLGPSPKNATTNPSATRRSPRPNTTKPTPVNVTKPTPMNTTKPTPVSTSVVAVSKHGSRSHKKSPISPKMSIKYKGNVYALPAFKEYCIQNPVELLNAMIVREFIVDGPGSMRAWFTGSVGYYVATGPLWGIRYNDGDEEECLIDDLIVRLRDTIQRRGVNFYY